MNNDQDIIDSRDVIKRLEELEAVKENMEEAQAALAEDLDNEELQEETDDAQQDYEDIKDELEALEALAEEASGSPGWSYGETLIRESYFKEYAQELADDIGAIDSNVVWPVNCIDWEEAASQLSQDYTKVDYDGVTYLIRG
jgi:predicted nuclease with TOPRIM domain